jgi:hypothetical protein
MHKRKAIPDLSGVSEGKVLTLANRKSATTRRPIAKPSRHEDLLGELRNVMFCSPLAFRERTNTVSYVLVNENPGPRPH